MTFYEAAKLAKDAEAADERDRTFDLGQPFGEHFFEERREMFVNRMFSPSHCNSRCKPCSPERRTAKTPITTISLNGPENWKLDEASVRFSGDSLQARIQSCSWALVDHMSPLPPFTLGIVGLGWLKCSMSETGNKVGFIP